MLVKPYGDRTNDGAVQLSFTLPLENSAKTREAARQLVLKLGFKDCEIVHAAALAEGFTMFIAYGYTDVGVDPARIYVNEEAVDDEMSFDEINEFIKQRIGRKVIVVGACTGSDAHTVGIDAIMNMKGYDHHFGLERYPMVEAYNLGAQVTNGELIERAIQVNADAILVSQVVTQRDIHIKNLAKFAKLLKEKGTRDRFIVIIGGPRISHVLAQELGFDAGFGRDTYPEHAIKSIVDRMIERQERTK